MRRRLLRGAASVIVAAAVTVPGTIQPAHAAPPPASTQVVPVAAIAAWVDIAVKAYDLINKYLAGSGTSIDDAIRQIEAKIEAAKTEILSHIDAIATADARACTRHHVIEFADIDLFSPTVLQSWAQEATGCVTLIDSLIDTVTDMGQSDQLGLALNVAGPIALAARIKAGFSTALLSQTLRDGNNAIIPKLVPACYTRAVIDPPAREDTYHCDAYNGDWAEGYRSYYRGRPQDPPINQAAVQNAATRNTSRAVAQAALPILQF
jgi:hypothetical protein